MVVWRNYIVLFGGFYEALKEVRFFSSLKTGVLCLLLCHCYINIASVSPFLPPLLLVCISNMVVGGVLQVRWFGDLYLFSFQDERWINIPGDT